MKFIDINVGQEFITHLLPRHAAEKCGIICIEKHQTPNKILVKRISSDEQWFIFADKNDECNMGNWILK